ncbi:MAG: hypothetical protein WKF50_13905 [Nocardioides sp.]
MPHLRTAAVAVAATCLVLTGGAATAATKSVKDKSGDAAQTADITSVQVRNDDRTLAISAKLAKAGSGRTHLVATLTSTTEGAPTYIARTVVLPAKGKSQAKRIGATLEVLAVDATETAPVECEGIKATLSSGRNGRSLMRIPQSCLGEDAGTLLVDVVTVSSSDEIADEIAKPLRVKRG